MFKQILLATDFSPASKAALALAVKVARKCEAVLHVVYVLPKMEGRVYKVMLRLAQKDLEKFLRGVTYARREKEILFCDSASQAIVKYTKQHGCEMIVVGSKGRTLLGDFLFGSVTRQLVRISKVPVMIVGAKQLAGKRRPSFRRILVPTDLSRESRKAFAFAIRFANFLDAHIHVLHVLDSRVLLNSVQKTTLCKRVDAKLKKIAGEIPLRQAAPLDFLSSRITTRTILGDPSAKIRQYAQDEKIDLMIMGTRRAAGLKKIVTGSVMATVASKSQIPVIAISVGRRV